MYQYKVTLRRVVDGDTVDVDIHLGFGVVLSNERIRLNGIDAPESRTSDKVEKIFGNLAKSRLNDLLADGDLVLVSDEFNPVGKFGRVLGDILVNGVSVCDTLINECYAAPYHGGSKELIENAHLENRETLIKRGVVNEHDISNI